MNKNTKPLKYIFENHFHQTWNNIKHKFPKKLHSSIWNDISKFLDCRDISPEDTAFTGIHSFGVIINIYTFSRNLDWNSHIHCIFTYGEYINTNQWKELKSISYSAFKKSWQKCSLGIISNFSVLFCLNFLLLS